MARNTFRDKTGKPSLIGHRGAGRGLVEFQDGYVKENTIESFTAAIEAGASWIETDVVQTCDGELFIHHDTLLHNGEAIYNLESQRARILGMTSLQEAFENIPENIGMIVEVKHVLEDTYGQEVRVGSSNPFSTVELTARALVNEKIKRPNRRLVSYGFSDSIPIELKKNLSGSEIDLGVIAEGGTSLIGMILTAQSMEVSIVSAHVTSLLGERAVTQLQPYDLESVLGQAHRLGIEVICWCPGIEESKILLAAGVDGVCVDNAPVNIPALQMYLQG
jgi:glycerophosphoryl diester phosphodiesterase